MPLITATQVGLTLCHDCHKLVAATDDPTHAQYCPRCGARLHRRLPNSLARTWAFLLSAMLLYIPANMLPILTIESFGRVKVDTIMSGIISLMHHGLWGIAIVVFMASILTPLLKMLSILLILISIHRDWSISARHRTLVYHMITFIGRWSMLDIFVIAVMVAVVEFKTIATISAGPGATFFAIVVVLTMLAAISFDPRLIWDRAAHKKN